MLRTSLVFLALTFPTLAQEPPTVTLTQAELQLLISVEVAKAQDSRVAQATQAMSIYQKIQSAFAQKPPAEPKDEPK